MEAQPAATPDTSMSTADGGLAALEPMFTALEKRLDALLEARLDAVEARRKEVERQALLTRFMAEHPDFRQLVASGALEAQKRLNPLLDDVGAYFAHQLEAERQVRADTLEAAKREAAAQAEARTMDRVRSKGLARTLSIAPAEAGRGLGVDPDLAAPEKFGGIHSVLAARLSARRQSLGR